VEKDERKRRGRGHIYTMSRRKTCLYAQGRKRTLRRQSKQPPLQQEGGRDQ